MKPVKDLEIKKDITVKEIVERMYEGGGFSAKWIKEARDIFKEMLEDKECVKFLSFPACIIATGLRGVIKGLVKNRMVDVIITTCGTLDHDLARIWKDYYHGTFNADDIELHKKGINRLGNIFVPNECYGLILEEKLQSIFEKIYNTGKKDLSTRELIWAVGEAIANESNAESSIVYWAWKNKIPIFVPGITDGAFGSQLWMFWQDHKDFNVNVLKDEQELADIVFTAKRTGALMIGGGISKHHTIWWNQFKDGLDYAIYITTAVEWDGSLSGARIREAISWGKVSEKAKRVFIPGDATLILPLIVGSL